MLRSIVVLVTLLVFNACFTAAETALFNVNQNRLKKKADEGDKKSILLKKIIEDPHDFLAVIRIGTMFVILLAGAVATQAFSSGLTDAFLNSIIPVSKFAAEVLSVLLVVVLLSCVFLLLGRAVPIRLTAKRADIIAAVIIPPINVFTGMIGPFAHVISASTHFLARTARIGIPGKDDDITEEEIRMMVDAGGETGTIDENEMEMINNIFEFDDKTAGDICTHRTDIIAIPTDAGEQVILSLLNNEKYSRIPVFEDNIDNIVGILHIKDVMKYIINDTLSEAKLNDIMRKPYFVPFSKKTDELFEEMQKNKIHIAVVVDEYGGTLGLVSMEDLIEEIMGNIFDEYDEEEAPDISPIDVNTYLISGAAELENVSDYLDVKLPDDYDTLSGFLVGQLGRIPEEGEQLELEWGGLLFKIAKMEENRIASAIVCRL